MMGMIMVTILFYQIYDGNDDMIVNIIIMLVVKEKSVMYANKQQKLLRAMLVISSSA